LNPSLPGEGLLRKASEASGKRSERGFRAKANMTSRRSRSSRAALLRFNSSRGEAPVAFPPFCDSYALRDEQTQLPATDGRRARASRSGGRSAARSGSFLTASVSPLYPVALHSTKA
jgi:hypothetical protein